MGNRVRCEREFAGSVLYSTFLNNVVVRRFLSRLRHSAFQPVSHLSICCRFATADVCSSYRHIAVRGRVLSNSRVVR
jgi:hypothetical protein